MKDAGRNLFVVLLLQGWNHYQYYKPYEKNSVVRYTRTPLLCNGSNGVVCSKYIYAGVVPDPATLLAYPTEYRISDSLVDTLFADGTVIGCSARAWRYEPCSFVAYTTFSQLPMERIFLLNALASCRTYTDIVA